MYGFGCNAFDCAAIYGAGKCEEVLGNWLEVGAVPMLCCDRVLCPRCVRAML